jgi:hypothetical protein
MAAVQKLEYSDLITSFGSLSPLIRRPNVHSIRALENQCIQKAIAIGNPDHPEMGYAGIFMNIGEYAMSDPNPYITPPNPGATPNFDPVDEEARSFSGQSRSFSINWSEVINYSGKKLLVFEDLSF